MEETNEQGNGDFDVQATAVLEKNIPDYMNASEADIAAAAAIQTEQEGVEVEELEKKVQEADRRRKKHEGTGGSNGIEQGMEAAVKSMQARLTEHYSQRINGKHVGRPGTYCLPRWYRWIALATSQAGFCRRSGSPALGNKTPGRAAHLPERRWDLPVPVS